MYFNLLRGYSTTTWTRFYPIYEKFFAEMVNLCMDIFILDSYVVFCFLTSGQHGGNTLDPNYIPGVDCLDHDFS